MIDWLRDMFAAARNDAAVAAATIGTDAGPSATRSPSSSRSSST